MGKKGFTLIEIITAVLIISVVAAGVFAAFAGGHQLMDYSRHRLQAVNFAREALDKLRCNYSYGSDAMSSCGASYCHDESDIGGNIIRGEMLNVNSASLDYNVAAGPETDSYKEVTVHVQWIPAKDL